MAEGVEEDVDERVSSVEKALHRVVLCRSHCPVRPCPEKSRLEVQYRSAGGARGDAAVRGGRQRGFRGVHFGPGWDCSHALLRGNQAFSDPPGKPVSAQRRELGPNGRRRPADTQPPYRGRGGLCASFPSARLSASCFARYLDGIAAVFVHVLSGSLDELLQESHVLLRGGVPYIFGCTLTIPCPAAST